MPMRKPITPYNMYMRNILTGDSEHSPYRRLPERITQRNMTKNGEVDSLFPLPPGFATLWAKPMLTWLVLYLQAN